jgi:hypothetical protein
MVMNPKLVFNTNNYGNVPNDAFIHPLDAAAIAALKKVPMLDWVIKKMVAWSYEKFMRVSAMANYVKASQKTFSHIYEMTQQSAVSLGVSLETPERLSIHFA